MSNIGTLYVYELDNGTVKVGRTSQPDTRMAKHTAAAKAHGRVIQRYWSSQPHENSDASESVLIDMMKLDATGVIGREWFLGVSFVRATEYAEIAVLRVVDDAEYYTRLMDAVTLVESHTGKQLGVIIRSAEYSNEVLNYFQQDEASEIGSASAYRFYRDNGGNLTQKQFVAALESAGYKRRRTSEGMRVRGLAFPDED